MSAINGVNQSGGAFGPGSVGASPIAGLDVPFLSAESLLQFIQIELEKKDGEIFAHMKNIEAQRDTATELTQAASQLKKLSDGKSDSQWKSHWYKERAGAYGEVQYTAKFLFGEMKSNTHSNMPAGNTAAQNDLGPLGPYAKKVVVSAGDPVKKEQYEAMVAGYDDLAKKLEASGNTAAAKQVSQLAADLKEGKTPDKAAVDKLVTDLEAAANKMSSGAEMTMIKLQELVQGRSRILMFVTNTMASMNESMRKIVENTR